MMDVTVSRAIAATPSQVAAVMFDPRRDPEWIGGAKSVEPLSGEPIAIGSRVRRNGGFMGKSFSWETEVVGYEPDRFLDMTFVAGPMTGGSVTYRIEPGVEGGSRVSIRNTGPGPGIMAWFVKRLVARDLDRLAKLVTAS